MPIHIHIRVPEIPSERWLRQQLDKLSAIAYTAGDESQPCVNTFDTLDKSRSSQAILLAADCVATGCCFRVYQSVVFELGNRAYLGPHFYLSEPAAVYDGPCGWKCAYSWGGSRRGGQELADPFDPDYAHQWKQCSWAQGLLTLAESLTYHVSGIAEEDKLAVEAALTRVTAKVPEQIVVSC